jgi:hypothetical protein
MAVTQVCGKRKSYLPNRIQAKLGILSREGGNYFFRIAEAASEVFDNK